MSLVDHSLPVLSCADAASWESNYLGDDEKRAWAAMERAGYGMGEQLLQDWRETGDRPPRRLLVLLGKGHNAGDALLATEKVLAAHPGCTATLFWARPRDDAKPLTQRAWGMLQTSAADRVHEITWGDETAARLVGSRWSLLIDGLLGMSFKGPLRDPYGAIIQLANDQLHAHLRAAVDLPSGLGDEPADHPFRADFTYATGIAKTPVIAAKHRDAVGRLRMIDIDFFADEEPDGSHVRILQPSLLDPLAALRPATADKRTYGRVLIVAGSLAMPGAALMATAAAVRGGAGLVTTALPTPLIGPAAAQWPEAMFVPLPTNDDGFLTPEALGVLDARDLLTSADAILTGPGMGRGEATRELLQQLVADTTAPLLLDADALQPELLKAVAQRPSPAGPVGITPHAGEFRRLAGDEADPDDLPMLARWAREAGVVLLRKGSLTALTDGESCYLSPFGGPILARGGSGDLLAGLAVARAAVHASETSGLLHAMSEAAVAHGRAADHWAQVESASAVRTTGLLDYLGPVLRGAEERA